MTRSIAEDTNRLSVFFLKKHGYLPQAESERFGGIKWTRGEWENSVNFWVVTKNEGGYVELSYTVTNHWTDEKLDIKHKVPLITTPCNYGGKRYWFRCPLIKNGIYCGRRVGVIYSVDNWFGCRYCADIAYQAQFEGGRFRVGSVSEPDVNKAYNEVKRKYYMRKPTRKYKRYLRLRKKMDNAWRKIGLIYGIEP